MPSIATSIVLLHYPLRVVLPMFILYRSCCWLLLTTFFGLRRDDLALPEERRRRMFEAEARVILGEERDAAVAKSALGVCAVSATLAARD